jgi:hypothetical protein
MGSKGCGGWSAIWVQLSRYGFPVFLVGARLVVGQWAWLARSGSLGFLARHAVQREVAHLKKKNHHFSFFPCCTSRGGRKRNSVVSKRHRSDFFFFTHETASF